MNVIGVIPARYASKRIKGKAIKKINNKPMLYYVAKHLKKAKNVDDVYVGGDSKKIKKVCKKYNLNYIDTRDDHPNGTSRVCEVVSKINKGEIIIVMQVDEPGLPSEAIDKLIEQFYEDKNLDACTLITPIRKKKEYKDPNILKVAIDNDGYALYFSRANLRGCKYKHIGVYAYTKEMLFRYYNMPPSNLSKGEDLEQLKLLQSTYKMKTVLWKEDPISVNTKKELKKARKLMKDED